MSSIADVVIIHLTLSEYRRNPKEAKPSHRKEDDNIVITVLLGSSGTIIYIKENNKEEE